MALRAVTDHPKFYHLKALLRLNKSCTLGYLEALWHFTGKFCPQGNIGKYPVDQIESWLEWDGEPGALVAAYVKARWVDVDREHGLLVHDWHKHADDAAKLALKRSNLAFVIPSCGDAVAEIDDTVTTTSGLPVSGAGAVPEADNNATTGAQGKFVPPTLDEVDLAMQVAGVPNSRVEAEKFIAKNSAVGWIVGNSRLPVTDWRHLVTLWRTNKQTFDARDSGRSGGSRASPRTTAEKLRDGSKFLNQGGSQQ